MKFSNKNFKILMCATALCAASVLTFAEESAAQVNNRNAQKNNRNVVNDSRINVNAPRVNVAVPTTQRVPASVAPTSTVRVPQTITVPSVSIMAPNPGPVPNMITVAPPVMSPKPGTISTMDIYGSSTNVPSKFPTTTQRPGSPGPTTGPGGGSGGECQLAVLPGSVPPGAIKLSEFSFATPGGTTIDVKQKISGFAPYAGCSFAAMPMKEKTMFASAKDFMRSLESFFLSEANAQVALGPVNLVFSENLGAGNPGYTRYMISGLRGINLANYEGIIYMVGFETIQPKEVQEQNGAQLENLIPSRVNICIAASCPNNTIYEQL